MSDKFKCPVCNGTGFTDNPHGISIDVVDVKRQMARQLRDKGFSVRQIQKALGYKSPGSIQHLLK